MSTTTRIYKIASPGDCFEPGRSGGEQALLGICSDCNVGVFFDSEGRFLRCEAKSTKRSSHPEQALEKWKKKIGFSAGAIGIQQFFLEDRFIGLTELPKCFRQFLNDANFIPTEDERREWRADIENWQKEGQFVLCWGREYWMSAEGLIAST